MFLDKQNARDRFLLVTEWLLLVTAVCKLITSAGANKLLTLPDPVLNMPTRYLLISAALVELGIRHALQRRSLSYYQKGVLIAWLGACFLGYKTLLWARDPDHPCTCLGFLGKWLLLSEHALTVATTILACALLAGGLLLMMSDGPSKRTEKLPQTGPIAGPN